MSGLAWAGSKALLVTIAFCTVFAVSSLPAPAEFEFRTWLLYDTGDHSNSLATADLDNDGNLDLALANRTSDTLSILLGVEEGGFREPLLVSGLDQPVRLATGDLDSDGNADLAVAMGGGLQILLGNGNGTFHPGALLMPSTSFDPIVIADFDGNDALDLAAGSWNSINIFQGNGDGSFQSAAIYGLGADPDSIAVGLLNDDEYPDLAASGHYADGISILLGTGDGGFHQAVEYPVGEAPESLAISDFDNDGNSDLVAANYSSHDLSVLLGHGDGTFTDAVDYPVAYYPQSVAPVDLDGDGAQDLVSNDLFTFSVLLGNGDGSFQPAESHSTGITKDLALHDWSGDGSIDLLTTNAFSRTVNVSLGLGDGSFLVLPTATVGDSPQSFVLEDFNGDGWLDAATANYGSEDFSILLGDGKGGFEPATEYGLPRWARWVIAEDLDSDGAIDLALFLSSDEVSVFSGNGDGTFQAAGEYFCGENPKGAIAEDLNGDMYPDLAVYDRDNSRMTILLNNGDGTFQPPVMYNDLMSHPTGLAATDMDFDGDLDLAVSNDWQYGVALYLNNGDGTFVNHQAIFVGDQVNNIRAVDVNGDTILDLVFPSTDQALAPSVIVCLGKPEVFGGFYQNPISYPTGHGAQSVIAADLDGDGHLDLATANASYSTVSILRGHGDGSFDPPAHFGIGDDTKMLVAGQLDGWGLPDLVVLNNSGNTLSIMINYGDLPPMVVAGPGPGLENPPLVRVFPAVQDAAFTHEFRAYGPDRWGVNVACGELSLLPGPEIITGPGPGTIYGPHVRGFSALGLPLDGLSFFAYGTLKYGVNVAAGDIDGDGFDEIITGAGPGAVFGPHVQAFDYDGGPQVYPVPGVSFFAYGTPRWGVNAAAGDIDGDGYDEIVTGPGPGNIYGPHVRGWNVDGGPVSAISAVNYSAYGTTRKGVRVSCGDVDGDGIDEIVTAPGPSPFFGSHVRGWNYDGAGVTAIAGVNFFAWPAEAARFGANVEAGADLDGDGRAELVVGGGPDFSFGTWVKVFTYEGTGVTEWLGFQSFPGMTGGAMVAAGKF